MKIKFVDLAAQNLEISQRVAFELDLIHSTTAYVGGNQVESFEREFAEFLNVKRVIGVANGTDALRIALLALGIGPGDEVITPAHSFIASSSAISFTGATPIWVDMDPETYNIDPRQIESAITERTRAIMPVHLYGQAADLEPILEIARRHRLLVIEDACQAHGARYKGRRVGSLGDFGAFSFYPGKNLGAYGDAGMLVTNDADLAAKVRMMRNYGQRKKYDHVYLAWNRRLDTLQAAVLRAKLPHLDDWNAARRLHASVYDELLTDAGLQLPGVMVGNEHVFHLYVVQSERRDQLARHLESQGIHTGIHYPIPIHLQEAYHDRGAGRGTFPVSEAAAPRLLSLPMYPELTEQQLSRIAGSVHAFASTSDLTA
jgi:dTDP-4-amino-4,6-dideoxygalactose transaminase